MRQEYFVLTAEVPLEKMFRFEKYCENEGIFLTMKNKFKLVDVNQGK